RNRGRRPQVANRDLQDEITPKNILMIGPTGVGKTEISRRLARMAGAPFIKVEATKFTEVGYVGRDVDSIIRDLAEISYEQTRSDLAEEVREAAESAAQKTILDRMALSPEDRQKMKLELDAGEYDQTQEVEVEVSQSAQLMTPDLAGMPGMEEIGMKMQSALSGMMPKKKRKMRIGDALDQLTEEEIDNRLDSNDIRDEALERIEQSAIVFIDEIDKIAVGGGGGSGGANVDVSRQGVQRDLLPLIEGTTVSTRYGLVNTDHILFIASGSFHFASPSDLIPELQGRLPVKVELSPLTVDDFAKILDGTEHCLMRQYEALLKTEGLSLRFSPEAVHRIAEIAQLRNEQDENIGARRLHTLMEKLLEDTAFGADLLQGKKVVFDAKMVDESLQVLAGDSASSRYII
ncbi:MAG: ATP-dependent protease ATPase subunit HslU, partial [Betaproteobacteria bacterium]|nr:ATP-dependent protease ATPase subunit HslU [Betaproteobacteria bacterium]